MLGGSAHTGLDLVDIEESIIHTLFLGFYPLSVRSLQAEYGMD